MRRAEAGLRFNLARPRTMFKKREEKGSPRQGLMKHVINTGHWALVFIPSLTSRTDPGLYRRVSDP